MSHQRIERIATDLAIVLFFGVLTLSTVALADAFLDWNLLAGEVEKVAEFLVAAFALQLGGLATLSLLLNVRRIAVALEQRAAGSRDDAAGSAR